MVPIYTQMQINKTYQTHRGFHRTWQQKRLCWRRYPEHPSPAHASFPSQTAVHSWAGHLRRGELYTEKKITSIQEVWNVTQASIGVGIWMFYLLSSIMCKGTTNSRESLTCIIWIGNTLAKMYTKVKQLPFHNDCQSNSVLSCNPACRLWLLPLSHWVLSKGTAYT